MREPKPDLERMKVRAKILRGESIWYLNEVLGLDELDWLLDQAERCAELEKAHSEACTSEPCIWSCDARKIDKELVERCERLEGLLREASEMIALFSSGGGGVVWWDWTRKAAEILPRISQALEEES